MAVFGGTGDAIRLMHSPGSTVIIDYACNSVNDRVLRTVTQLLQL